MQTSLESQEGLKRRLKVVVPAEAFTAKQNEILKKKAQQAKLDGFRPGKAPIEVVAKYFASSIAEETVDALINTTLPEAYSKEKIFPVNRPSIDALKMNANEPFEYVAEFEVAPEIETIHFDNITIEKVNAAITPEDVETVIEKMAKQFGTFAVSDKNCANEDRVTIDFEGSINGELFEGGSANNHTFVLGQGQMIPDFEKGILGMKAGEEKIIDVIFPENYHADLSGKQAQFKIKVDQVEVKKAIEIDEAFAKRFGVASGDLTELRKEIEKTLTRELNKKLHDALHKKVFDELVTLNPIELPHSIVHEEIHHLMEDAKARFQKMSGQKNAPDFPHSMFKGEAERRIRCSYLILKIVKDEKLKPDAAKIRARAEEMAASYENPDQARDYFLSNKESYQRLENLVLEDEVVDVLLARATIKSVEKSYQEAMGESL